ncbi:hypothetical protein JCM8097_001022 [Rhodosporidiobolus ruineniae]
MPPTLPRELVEQILGDEGLDQRTLARCCRISRDYLDFVQRRLYSHIPIFYTPSDGQLCDDTEYVYDTQSASLLFTLGRYPHLGGLVRSAAFRMDGYCESNVYMTRRQAVAGVVKSCPDLQRLGCPAFGGTQICSFLECVEGRSFTLLDLGYPQDCMWPVLELHQGSLKHLVFLDEEMAWAAYSSPPPSQSFANLHLESLVICQYADVETPLNAVFEVFTAASHSSLTFLRLPFHPHICTSFSSFSSLTRLELDLAVGDDMDALIALVRTAPGVTYLGFPGRLTDDQRERLLQPEDGLAAALPLTLRSLRLPQNFLPSELYSLLPQLRQLFLLRVVDFCPPHIPHIIKVLRTPSPPPPRPDYEPAIQAYAAQNLHLVELKEYWDSDTDYYLREL